MKYEWTDDHPSKHVGTRVYPLINRHSGTLNSTDILSILEHSFHYTISLRILN